jgi:hypothetical protein
MNEKKLIEERGYNPHLRVPMIITIAAMVNLLIFPGAVEERLQDASSFWGSQHLLTIVAKTKALTASIGLNVIVDTIRTNILSALQ